MELTKELHLQLKSEDAKVKQDAKYCLIIANKLKELNDGHVWSNDWRVLARVRWVKDKEWKRQFEPSEVGKIFIKGLGI
jgi:hypothetical protein